MAAESRLPSEVRIAAANGWRLFPVKQNGKVPLVKEWQKIASCDLFQLQEWKEYFGDCNWGLATGAESGVVVIDIDGELGRESVAALQAEGFILPRTLSAATGRPDGGEHRYYRVPPGIDVGNDQNGKIAPHIDVRGRGGFVVTPPSVHQTGKAYTFINPEAPLTPLPTWVIERLGIHAPPLTARPPGEDKVVSKGERTKLLVSMAGTMIRRGMSLSAVIAALLAENSERCRPPLDEEKVRSIAVDTMERYGAGDPRPYVASPEEVMTQREAGWMTAYLLGTIQAWILRYVVVAEAQATILATWVLHTYVLDAADITPYMHITAPEKESGKSLLVDVLAAVTCNPIRSGGMTAAALVRTIDSRHPTLFLDEMDSAMGADKEFAEAARGILNEGFHREGCFYKCDGKNHDLREFRVFCCKCLAGIGKLPDTVASRSIAIEMRRKIQTERVTPFRRKAVGAAAIPIRVELDAWVVKGAATLLQSVEPHAIDRIGDRQNDVSEPLLAIAQLAGEEWLQRLIAALVGAFGAANTEDKSIGATLLLDIRTAFTQLNVGALPSKELVEYLCQIEGSPWPEWNRGKGLSPNTLAQQLKKFKVSPQTIRIGTSTPKGYRRTDLEDSWSRYCPAPPVQDATPPQPASSLTEPAFSDSNTPQAVAAETSASNRYEQGIVADVAVPNQASPRPNSPAPPSNESAKPVPDAETGWL